MIRSLKSHKYLIWITSILFVALSQMACSKDDSNDLSADDDLPGLVSFNVITPKITRSDTPWGEDLDNENENFDNTILTDQLHVVISDTECTKELELTNLVFTKASETADHITYECKGRVPVDQMDFFNSLTEGKLHILANAGYSAKLSVDPTFIKYGMANSEGFSAIPMWGVLKGDFSNLGPNTTLNLGDVTLLRAMAKVEIDINNEKEDNFITALKSVTISTLNPKGHLLPNDWKNVDDTKQIDRNADVRIPANQPGQSKAVTFNFTEGNHVEFYLPEVRNSEDEIKLTLTYVNSSGGEQTGDLYFCNYRFGKPEEDSNYNVQRNYIYSYTVWKSSITDLSCDVDIQPFTQCVLEADYGLLRDERGDLMVVPDNDGNLPDWFNKFLEDYPDHLPKDEDTQEELKPIIKGDYYAIVRDYGEMDDAVIWLKDGQGCRVLTSFSKKDQNDENCNTRKVIYFFGLSEIVYHKDTAGFRRIYHFPNHNSIVLAHGGDIQLSDGRTLHLEDNTLMLRVPVAVSEGSIGNLDATKEMYLVESFTADPFECWIVTNIVENSDGTETTTFTKVDGNGNILTGQDNIKSITE